MGVNDMNGERGRLYESVFLDLNDSHCLKNNIYEALNEARKHLINIETIEQLHIWITEWFGEIE